MARRERIGLDQKLETVGQLVTRARVYFDIWWLYAGADTRSKYIQVMDEYSEFFRFDEHAHFVAMVTYLAQLFESRRDTMNLPALVDQAAAGRAISARALSAVEAVLQAARPTARKVAILRSNLFAHRSQTLTYEETFSRAAVKPDQLRALTDSALEAINLLRAARGMDERVFHPLSSEDAARLLDALGANEKRAK